MGGLGEAGEAAVHVVAVVAALAVVAVAVAKRRAAESCCGKIRVAIKSKETSTDKFHSHILAKAVRLHVRENKDAQKVYF